MSSRRVALIGPMTGERQVVHTTGYPIDPEQMLPIADVVLLIDEGKGGAMLFRYTAYGEIGGDTLHASADDAEAQADGEYGSSLLGWMDVPADVADAHVFAIRYAADRLNERG